MLSHLSVKQLTLVDSLDLEFEGAMNVVTGETGAGKSVLLGALGLAMGDRADNSLIAPGATKAEVCAAFELDSGRHGDVMAYLSERALDDGNQCVMRRVLSADGRSRAFINGSTVNVSDLRTVGEQLINIHSQHEHQLLLRRERHRKLLDEFAGLQPDVTTLNDVHAKFNAAQTELAALQGGGEERSARAQLLAYQAEELAELALGEHELAELGAEHKRLSNADANTLKLHEAIALIAAEDREAADALTARAHALVAEIDDEATRQAADMLSNAMMLLKEASDDLAALSSRFDVHPERLQQVEERLGTIHDLARKHRRRPEELPQLLEQINAELGAMARGDERVAELEVIIDETTAEFLECADALSAKRQAAAKKLQAQVVPLLRDLGMAGASFEVCISAAESREPRQNGLDDIEFLVTTIPGSEPRPLRKIASGGELSRISLAIQTVTAQSSETPTLVFDEVDVGVGGATAEVVGGLLRRLGKETQVLCVTHLPQVAAQGQHHYVVAKRTSDKSASVSVNRLSEEERVEEIARMLGGVTKTDQTYAHANSMLKEASHAP